jgi:L-lactate dehydrogenase
MTQTTALRRYPADDLRQFASRLLQNAGLPEEPADTTSRVLLEADLLGFSTHGLMYLPANLNWLEKGKTRAIGEPEVLIDRGPVINWSAGYLPGPYVMVRAVEVLCERAREYGVATLTLRKSQHVACLAPYVLRAAEQGLAAWMIAATPAERLVCPHGGIRPLFSTNPFAFAVPTGNEPILMDMSFAVTAGSQLKKAFLEGRRMPTKCIIDREGNLTDDPKAALEGALLPLGGLDHGHKGYGLMLWNELLATALGGWGRADDPDDGDANSVLVQVMDPEAFGSLEAFKRQADYLVHLCRKTPTRPGDPPVRTPGERALALRRRQLAEGVALSPLIISSIEPWAAKLSVPMPSPSED